MRHRSGPRHALRSLPGTVAVPDRARAILAYDESSRGPILALKHADRLELVPGFARWLERTGRELIEDSELIVPVPLHRMRLWRRRYNQAAELGRAPWGGVRQRRSRSRRWLEPGPHQAGAL